MNPHSLRCSLRALALQYATAQGLAVDQSHPTAILFQEVAGNFFPESFANITSRPDWNARLQKVHAGASGHMEMQSSNSSDALLMNVFCHPRIGERKGIRDLLGLEKVEPQFGFKPGVALDGGLTDDTEIDMVLDGLFCEAKLTEKDFCQKREEVVRSYSGLGTCFHEEHLPRKAGEYDNYQMVRNLLAADQHGKDHVLLCDERRPDLARRYFETVACLRAVDMRRRCRVVFWQELARNCGPGLAAFLEEKYGI